jgi:HemX protein
MVEALHAAAVLLYAAAAGLLFVSLARGDERRLPGAATLVFAAGLLAHGAAVAAFTLRFGELPLVGLGPALSSLGLLIALGTLMAATLGHAGTVGLVLAPLVTVLTGVGLAVRVHPIPEEDTFRSVWIVLHVLFAMVGFVGLALAFAAGLMYLLQFRELKSKHFGAIFRVFPPLDTLERLGRRGVLVGFPFLTLALVLGFAWIARFDDPRAVGNPKLLWGALSWSILLAVLLAGRGRRAALFSVIGFVVVVVAYVVLRLQHAGGPGFL